jgi:hypothetical protein
LPVKDASDPAGDIIPQEFRRRNISFWHNDWDETHNEAARLDTELWLCYSNPDKNVGIMTCKKEMS